MQTKSLFWNEQTEAAGMQSSESPAGNSCERYQLGFLTTRVTTAALLGSLGAFQSAALTFAR